MQKLSWYPTRRSTIFYTVTRFHVTVPVRTFSYYIHWQTPTRVWKNVIGSLKAVIIVFGVNQTVLSNWPNVLQSEFSIWVWGLQFFVSNTKTSSQSNMYFSLDSLFWTSSRKSPDKPICNAMMLAHLTRSVASSTLNLKPWFTSFLLTIAHGTPRLCYPSTFSFSVSRLFTG